MPGVVIPGLGYLLRDWRTKQGRSRFHWGFILWTHGCGIAPVTIARRLAHAERTDEWLAPDPATALRKLLESSSRGLVRGPEDEPHLEKLADMIYAFLLDG